MKNLNRKRGASFWKTVGLLFVAASGAGSVHAWSPTNFSDPLDAVLWANHLDLLPDNYEKADAKEFKIRTGVSVEYGFDPEGRNADNEVVDAYQIWGSSQSAFVADSSIVSPALVAATNLNLLATTLNFGPNATAASPVSIVPTSRRDQTDLTFWGRLALPLESVPGQIEASAYVPVRFLSLDSMSWALDTTVDASAAQPAGALSASTIGDIDAVLDESTGNLDYKTFEQSHIGDLYAMVSWRNHYTQVNESLSNISLFAQAGVLVPTSVTRDADKALAIPLGNDNALAIPFGGAVNLHFMDNFRVGVAADFLASFGEDSNRRMRTNAFEGELIVPRKFNVHRDPGVLIKLMGLAEVTSTCKRFFGGVAYQFAYRNEDKFTSNDAGFNATVANSSEAFKEKSYHNLIARAGFDFRETTGSDFAPRLSMSYKHPLKGRRVAMYKTFTCEASISF